MTEPRRPILNYKTPEKGQRVTAGIVIWRVLSGFSGMLALLIALAISGATLGALTDQASGWDERILGGVVGLCFAPVAWFFTIRWLKYSIVGDRKPEKFPIEKDE